MQRTHLLFASVIATPEGIEAFRTLAECVVPRARLPDGTEQALYATPKNAAEARAWIVAHRPRFVLFDELVIGLVSLDSARNRMSRIMLTSEYEKRGFTGEVFRTILAEDTARA